MFVVKRNGESHPVSFDKITHRITLLCKGLASQVDPVVISQKVGEALIFSLFSWRIPNSIACLSV